MRRSRPSPEHAEAVSRRLAALSAELASVRGEPGAPPVAVAEHVHTRIRSAERPAWPAEPVERAEPPVRVERVEEPPPDAGSGETRVPVPGRHASRRGRSPLADARTSLTPRPRLTPAHLAVVAVVVAVALAALAWTLVASRPEVATVAPRVDPPPTAASGPASEVPGAAAAPAEGSSAGSDSGAASTGEVVVDVAGRVRRPGIAVLPAGSRVVDALEAAGGARPGVDLAGLNLARPLVDGEQVLVGVGPPSGPLGTVGSPGTAAPSGAPAALVDLNTADEALLDTLPGVGPVTAAAIVAWRGENGGFTSVEELLDVDGIGEATLADLAPLVTV